MRQPQPRPRMHLATYRVLLRVYLLSADDDPVFNDDERQMPFIGRQCCPPSPLPLHGAAPAILRRGIRPGNPKRHLRRIMHSVKRQLRERTELLERREPKHQPSRPQEEVTKRPKPRPRRRCHGRDSAAVVRGKRAFSERREAAFALRAARATAAPN